MHGEDNQSSEVALTPWNPEQALRSVDAATARYSRGYLRCRPEKWFPGVAMQWLPLAHSLGIELKLLEAKPVVNAPRGLDVGFVGTIDDEPIGLLMDGAAAEELIEVIVPGSQAAVRKLVLEYMARRLLTSLAISWSGPETAVVQFEPEMKPSNVREVGGIKMTVSLNGTPTVVWLLLGKVVVEKLDGLWRRQLQSTSRQNVVPLDVQLEVAHLTVPPPLLSDYLRPGTTVDLEVPVSDAVLMIADNQAWMPGRMCRVGGNLAVETVSGAVKPRPLPSGTTRLSIELGSVHLDAALAAEMSQVGAIYDTGIKAQDHVSMVVNGEKVGEALLRSYQGRFVVSVL